MYYRYYIYFLVFLIFSCIFFSYVQCITGSVTPLVSGGTVHGVVSMIDPYHCVHVTLPHPLPGVLDITDVSDHFVPSPLRHFTQGQFIKCVKIRH